MLYEVPLITTLARMGGGLLLMGGCFAQSPADAPPLTRIAATRSLTRDVADRGVRVLVHGVVTWRKGVGEFAFQDETEGTWGQIAVARRLGLWNGREDELAQLREGTAIEVEGITSAGGFAPVILPRSIRVLGPGALPPARPFDRRRFLAGAESGQRIQLSGSVLDYLPGDGGWKLILQVETDKVWVSLTKEVLPDPRPILDATVTVRGVGATAFNSRGEVLNTGLRVSIPGDLQVEPREPLLPSAVPFVPLGQLRAFQSEAETPRRFRVHGVATFVLPERFLLLQEGDHVIRVEGHNLAAIAPADLVEAVGYVDMSLNIGMLSGAEVAKIGAAQLPAPIRISPAEILAINTAASNTGQRAKPHDFNGHLIRFNARLLAVEPLQEKGVSSRKLSLQHGTSVVEAVLNRPDVGALDAFAPGSELEITGLAQLEFPRGDGLRATPRPLRVGVVLRSPADLRVIATPPWWTVGRIMALVSVAALTFAGTLLWVRSLRRQIKRKTELLTEEMRARRDAAIEFQATLRERMRLAANLHDTLLQSLGGIGFQLDACQSAEPPAADEAAHILVARQMVTHATREVRDSVWALRSLSLDGQGVRETLAALVQRMAVRQRAAIDLQAEGEFSGVSEFVAGNLVLAVQEALHNALKHGAPNRITVRLELRDNALIAVTITDDGCGFALADAAGATEGHFGLAGIRERVKTLGGSARIESEPGRGTTIVLQVPLRSYDTSLL